MIHFKTLLDRYDWDIEVFIIVRTSNVQTIANRLKYLGCSDNTLHKSITRLRNYEDSGFTYSNPRRHKSLMVINRPESIQEFLDTYNHEKNHVVMHICEELGINPYSEQASYLAGELSKLLFLSALENLRNII